MLWVPYPSSETSAIDSCSRLYPQIDTGSLTNSLYTVDLGFFKLGRDRGGHRVQTRGSATPCLRLCRQTNGTSTSLATGKLHRCVDAQASWGGSGLVLESLTRSSGQTLEAQLTGIRFTDSSEEGLTSQLVGNDMLDCSRLNGERLDVKDSGAEAEEQNRNSRSEGLQFEEKRQLECPKSGDLPPPLGVKRASIRTPVFTPGLSVSGSRVNETILYLESIGVDCSRLINQEPRAVACNIHRVRRLVHALEYYGLKRKELGRIINMCPKIVYLTAENDLKPVVNFLLDEVGFPREGFSKLIKRCPRLLVCNVNEQLRPTLWFLRTLGFSRMGGVISNNPTLLAFSVEKNLVPKLKYLESLGLSYKAAASMVIRFPAIFNYSVEENLQHKYDYLVNEIGGNLDDLIAFPQYFGYSLEKRIKPRHQYIAKLNIRVSLPAMLKLSEVEFISRFQSSKPEQSTKVTLPLEEASPVKFNGAVVKNLTVADLRESGTRVLMGAQRS